MRQGSCGHPARLWATSDYVPGFEAMGTLEAAWAM